MTATAERLAELCARPLDECRWPIVMLDGVHLGEHLLVVALGVAADGTKVPLGPNALIQRCRRHKERNIPGHLPEAERPLLQPKLRAAWANPDTEAARRELEALARALDKKRPGAAASLREGLEDTLTVNRLGIPAACSRPWSRPTRSSR